MGSRFPKYGKWHPETRIICDSTDVPLGEIKAKLGPFGGSQFGGANEDQRRKAQRGAHRV